LIGKGDVVRKKRIYLFLEKRSPLLAYKKKRKKVLYRGLKKWRLVKSKKVTTKPNNLWAKKRRQYYPAKQKGTQKKIFLQPGYKKKASNYAEDIRTQRGGLGDPEKIFPAKKAEEDADLKFARGIRDIRLTKWGEY